MDHIATFTTRLACSNRRSCLRRQKLSGLWYCKNAELLTSSTQLTQFNWFNKKPVAIVQFEILGIDHEYQGTEAPGMMYSSVFVRELMEG